MKVNFVFLNGRKKMFRYFIILTLIFFVPKFLFSQKVVVSEYYNVTGDPVGEWTELLVIEDNIDLVGYTLRDNAGSTPPPSQWTGGVRFKNHPLWRNLRAGTIIVINHRYTPYQSVDVDKRDGFIEIDAEDETYFEKRCFNCIVGPEWYQKALNIAQESEIVQILDPNDNHVHALAHMPSSGGDWVNIPEPKICHVGSITRGGVTVRVCPGQTLSAYNKGFDTRGEEATQSADLITKGKPNNRTGYINQNQLFWRSLRDPKWNSPSAIARVFKDSVILSWNPMIDPFPQDSLAGYLFVRIPHDLLSSVTPPVDGRRYTVGDNLGSGIIVGIINASQATRFVDRYSLQCGRKYVYRIYAFRFRFDDFNEDGDETNARGRSYNERNFAQVEVEKISPPKPEILLSKGATKICEGDTVVIKVQNSFRYGKVNFRWFESGNLIKEGIDSLVVLSSGSYRVEVVDTLGCSTISESIAVSFVKYPQLILQANGKLILNDTTFILCPGESLKFDVLGWFKYKFFKDNNQIDEAEKSEWSVSSNGTYYFSATNDFCVTYTPKVRVKFLNLNLTINPKLIKVFVDKDEVEKDTVITLTNIGEDTVVVEKISFDNNTFTLISPKPPIMVLPKGNVNLLVRFKPLSSGIITSKMFLQKNCNLFDTIAFEGTKAKTVLIYTEKSIDFGTVPDCFELAIDSSFTLINSSDGEINLDRLILDKPFEILEPALPVNLIPGKKITFKFKLPKTAVGTYNGLIKIFYNYSNITDSLVIPIIGKVEKIQYSIERNFSDNLVFGECDVSKRLSFLLLNKSSLDLTFSVKSENNDVKIINPFSITKSLDSSLIEFDLIPNNLGANKTKIYILLNPCSIFDSLEVEYYKKGIIVSLATDTIDFGRIFTCDNQKVLRKSNFVSIIGDTLGLTKIKSVNYSQHFEVIFPKDSLLANGTELIFVFNPINNGKYFGELNFILEPCGTTHTIYVKGEFVQGKYLLSRDTIDFGEVEIGTSKTQKLLISNVGDTLISINKSSLLDEENFSINPKGNIDSFVRSSDTLEFDIVFKPVSEGSFVSIVEIVLGFPCNKTVNVVLKGIGKAPIPERFEISIDKYKFKPFTIAKIPVNFKFQNNSYIGFDSLKFDINYYNRVFYVSSVYSGSFVINHYVDSRSGKIRVVLNSNKQILSEGVLLYLEGMILIGDQKHSDLSISNFEFYGSVIPEVVTKNGSVEIDSVCMPNLRLISSELIPKFDVYLSNSFIQLNVFATESLQNLEVFLYDLLGNCIFARNISFIPVGETKVQYPLNISDRQKYFCVIRLKDLVKACSIKYLF